MGVKRGSADCVATLDFWPNCRKGTRKRLRGSEMGRLIAKHHDNLTALGRDYGEAGGCSGNGLQACELKEDEDDPKNRNRCRTADCRGRVRCRHLAFVGARAGRPSCPERHSGVAAGGDRDHARWLAVLPAALTIAAGTCGCAAYGVPSPESLQCAG